MYIKSVLLWVLFFCGNAPDSAFGQYGHVILLGVLETSPRRHRIPVPVLDSMNYKVTQELTTSVVLQLGQEDQLHSHLHKVHFWCHFCEGDGKQEV